MAVVVDIIKMGFDVGQVSNLDLRVASRIDEGASGVGYCRSQMKSIKPDPLKIWGYGDKTRCSNRSKQHRKKGEKDTQSLW